MSGFVFYLCFFLVLAMLSNSSFDRIKGYFESHSHNIEFGEGALFRSDLINFLKIFEKIRAERNIAYYKNQEHIKKERIKNESIRKRRDWLNGNS